MPAVGRLPGHEGVVADCTKEEDVSEFVEFSWPTDESGVATASFKAVDQFLSGKALEFEAFLALDRAVNRRVLRVLLDDSHGGGAGVTPDDLREVVERTSSTHTFQGTVDVRYEIEAARLHADNDPTESHRWWHRW